MDDISRYAVGLDVGTENVRAVVASVNKNNEINIIGFNEVKNSGMRKGVVANLTGPSDAINDVLGEVERMCGFDIKSATISVNGAQILTTRAQGMIAVGAVEHEINTNDLNRVQEVAVSGRIPANREILNILPFEYVLDEQGGIKDPIGMTGARLELRANVVSALAPNCANLRKVAEGAKVVAEGLVPSVIAAAKAVLNERQFENGVAVVDLGATTTSVAIYEEGDLQYVGVVPVGSNNITNDLAIMLEIDTDVAEEIKRRYVTADFVGGKDVVVKNGREELKFEKSKIDEVVMARLEEIFEKIRKELKKANYDKRLPEGIVLVGGGARMKNIEVFAKKMMETSVKIGIPKGLGGVANMIEKPEYASVVGLALYSACGDNVENKRGKTKKMKDSGGVLKKIFGKFSV